MMNVAKRYRTLYVRCLATKPKPIADPVWQVTMDKLSSLPVEKAEMERFKEEYKKFYSSKEESTSDIIREGLRFVIIFGTVISFMAVMMVGPEIHSDWRTKKVRQMSYEKELQDLEIKMKLQELQQRVKKD